MLTLPISDHNVGTVKFDRLPVTLAVQPLQEDPMNAEATVSQESSSTVASTPVASAAEPDYLRGNFAPMSREVTAHDLRVRGHIPQDLDGRLLRIGPSPIGPRD